jgi:two-component system sensor histidine kinase/response regulator
MMGGNIGANSSEGQGSTFWFALPLPVVTADSAAPTKRSGHILVVDDNERSRAALADQLTDAGFTVAVASDGAQALSMLRTAEHRFEVALIDHYMPALDGIALGAEISKAADVSATRLVLLTSVDHTSNIQCVTTGTFFGYLTKPVRTSTLLDCIDRALLHVPSREQSPPVEAATPTRPALRWAGVRVLVAEDNVVNQRVARRFLERLGCEVHVVDDGAQAVEVLMRTTYDFVLMDMQMPIMDGLEASRRIRAQELTGQRIPIVALTADAMVGTFERCLEAGMDDYLTKPIDVKRLEDVLARFLVGDDTQSASVA